MLKRVRIEVEAGSPDEAVCDLTKYEHALQAAEAERYGLGRVSGETFRNWGISVAQRDFYNRELGREITEEVIEYDASGPSYLGRRVVHYRRIDNRDWAASMVPPPRVVDHWEDRTDYPDQSMTAGPELPDLDRLRSSADAKVWAEEFAKVAPEIDPGFMIGWFANIVETARVLDRGGDPTEVKVTTGGISPGIDTET
jgi:hypothetical protein